LRIRSAIRFKASFGNAELLQAMLSIAKGQGKIWAIRLWELETINALGWTESAWCRLSLAERARKVCAYKAGGWLSALETERELKKMKAK